MAVRFDADADRLLRTTDLLNYNAAYTIMGWIYILSSLTFETIFGFNDNSASNEDTVYTRSSDTAFRFSVNGGGFGGSIAYALNTWYHVALVRSSATALTIYVNGVAEGTTATTDVSARATVTRMESGGALSTNQDRLDGRVAAIKAWSTNLTVAEILQEMVAIHPIRTANLYGWWPAFPGTTERLIDYSGNGRDWTAAGTLADEDPPPVSWGGTPLFIVPSSLNLEQEGYRFRADDGDEDTATWLATQDANITRAALTNTRLRVIVNATGDPTSNQYQLEYRKVGDTDWKKVT